jgi:hypothetical protein
MLAFLEDCRVLYNLTEFEYPIPCHKSVSIIREKVSTELGILENSAELAKQLRGIRSECRAFQDACEQKSLLVERISDYPYPAKHWEFIEALSQLRKGAGFHITAISVSFGLDLEESLASILPPADEDAEHGVGSESG